MPTSDFSRWSTDFRKRYDGVRMQQGRVVTDDDVNEGAHLEFEDRRESRVDIIGPAGSPDDGFLIANPSVTPAGVDFDIDAGTLYLGGLRLRLDDATTYLSQSDFLEITPITAPADGRIDLVFIEAWQQHVSAIEDNELFEKALAGPDTSTRLKTLQRIHVAEGVSSDDCHDALTEVLSGMAAFGTLNGELEFKSDTKLTITKDPDSNPANLCDPPVQGGYLGAENQAIRVEIVDGTHFTWGFDNASPMYRVQLSNDPKTGKRTRVHMLTAPKDQVHWPLADQTIELLPWGALLPNGEKVAETSGLLAKVNTSFNPDDQNFIIDVDVPPAFGMDWQNHAAAADLALNQFFFMRVWNRGSDLATDAAITFAPNGAAVPLGETGLLAQFLGTQFRHGDHWVVAARPETRDLVVPWQLLDKREPHGYRRFLMPLGLIQWTFDPATESFTGAVIDDCRPTFLPLTRVKGCCTYTVGDGVESFGQFLTIQAAVDKLPAAGGEVCVLPGKHFGNVRIIGRRRIRIHGCGLRSILLPGEARIGEPLIDIESSEFIELHNLRLQSGVLSAIRSRQGANQDIVTSHLKFDELEIETAHVAMDLEADNTIDILHNDIALGGSEFKRIPIVAASMAAITVRSTDVLIERNSITIAADVGRLHGALGGIHLRGGCERVEIRRNHILGGNGNGITLGSFVQVQPGDEDGNIDVILWPGIILIFDDDGCPVIIIIPPGDPNNPPPVIRSEGFLYDILIHDNRIEHMGMSGIAAAYVINPNGLATGAPSIRGAVVIGLEISNNIVESCLQLEIGDFPAALENKLGFGGIALQTVEDLRIRENRIRNNGTTHADPVCGIFAASLTGGDIEENTIVGNGPFGTANRQSFFGTRGGIILPQVREIGTSLLYMKSFISREQRSEFAVRVHDNIVASPLGPALLIGANGVVSVDANHFTSYGFPRRDATIPGGLQGKVAVSASDYTAHKAYLANTSVTSRLSELLGSAVVVIINLGRLTEVIGLEFGFANATFDRSVQAAGATQSNGGQILFNNNQVLGQSAGNNPPPRFCVLLMSLDDVSMSANQSDYQGNVPFIMNALVFGMTVRITANRFQEPFPATAISALTAGLLNITSINQATHCIVALPISQTIDLMNQPPACEDRAKAMMQAFQSLLSQ
jgi:hypothetical protein